MPGYLKRRTFDILARWGSLAMVLVALVPLVAVLGYDYWRTRFAAAPAIVGKTVQINGAVFRIAGVAEPDFFGVSPPASSASRLPIRRTI